MGKRNRPRKGQKRESESWTLKDGLLVPANPDLEVVHVEAASDEGAEAIIEMIKRNAPDLPQEALNAGYDGSARANLDRKVVVDLRSLPIAWGFPFDELTYSKWVINLLGLRLMPWDDFLTAYSTYLPDARNIIHGRFVKQSKCEWLMMIDSDVMTPPDIIRRLLAHEKKMVGGYYHMKAEPYSPVVYERHKDLYDPDGKPLYRQYTIEEEDGDPEQGIPPKTGLESVDAAGAGCWLMHREIAEALGPAPYDMIKGGEDLVLCQKVLELGYEIFIDWDTPCAHLGVAHC